MTTYSPGSLVTARGRDWVVLPGSDEELLVLRPLGGNDDDTAGVLPALEEVHPASFPPPQRGDLGDAASGQLLRTALQIGFRSTAGPFRSLGKLAVEPRAYQYVPLLMALRQDPVRILISDDVGIGKTIEAGMVAAEMIAQGDIERLAVLCGPALAEQWQRELREKFSIDAELVLPSTAGRLSRGLMLDESLFERYPFTVVSTDFIKSPQRRHEFVNHCPKLVIIDEAHTCVADGAGGGGGLARTQRYDLAREVAADRSRHLVLVTATPHSGKEQGFRNLVGLLDPELATVDLDTVRGRERLARHFVQRRRADIRHYISEDTEFPSDRETKEVSYRLSPEYAALFDKVLAYTRGQVTPEKGHAGPHAAVRQRVRWWSALALLRALASSPAAAAETLRTRASSAGATNVADADRLGRASVLDTADTDSLEGIDVTPGADPDAEDETGTSPESRDRRRLLELAREADRLVGTKADRKLAALVVQVKGLLSEGYNPIVFCRFIKTAEYVAEQLKDVLVGSVGVAAVTGELPPELRQQRIAELGATSERRVLVATDCLSEGVNLQDNFDAVVHYDLAWNPTRHEQREGRVDRFGQRRDIVRAITMFGADNGIDRIVLDVLIRKFKVIRERTGVSVPVPDEADNVVMALVEGLLIGKTVRGQQLSFDTGQEQLALDIGQDEQRARLHAEWDSAAEREHASRTKYAQEAIHPEEALREAQTAREALGSRGDVERFTVEALRALGAPVTPAAPPAAWTADVSAIPSGLKDALPVGLAQPLAMHRDLPVPRDHIVLARTDPAVEAVARFVLDAALDPVLGQRVASRAGVARTRGVDRRTTLLLLRFRFHLDLPGVGGGTHQQVCEEARFAAFTGPPERPAWLEPREAAALVDLHPDANVDPGHAAELLEGVLAAAPSWAPHLDSLADELAAELLDAHRRVRAGAGAARRGLAVSAEKPVDLLGSYIFLPVPVQ